MKLRSSIFVAALFLGAALAQIAGAQPGPEPPAQAQSNPSAQQEALYAEGTKAMNEQRWFDAVTVYDHAAEIKGQRTTASLYWKAYSLEKLGRKDESGATCDNLNKQAPSSSWNRECLVLKMRSMVDVTKLADLARQTAKLDAGFSNLYVRPGVSLDLGGGSPYVHPNQPASEDDIKLLALNSLMRRDPAKAVPLLRDFIKSDKPVSTRQQALFVISRSKDPQAQALLTNTATAKGDPEMQRAAVQVLSLNRGKDADPTLVEVYRGSTDAGVKRAVINGLYLAHDAPRLVDLARSEKDLNMKRDIVSQLSLMNDQVATDYMLELLK
jgi:hypothetical protein